MTEPQPSSDTTAAFLSEKRNSILEAAEAGLARTHVPHYESAGSEQVRRRLGDLLDRLIESLATRDVASMTAHAEHIAEERFRAGYDLSEVQVAFNALEEATWTSVLADLQAAEYAQALGLVSTVLGAGKDALARRYVSLAAGTRAPSLDLRALFAGTS
ncbi:MAG: hypothetical protein ACM3QU_05995 [Verrucomicrobiota bacterium]